MTVSEVMIGNNSMLTGDINFPLAYNWSANFTAQGIPPDEGTFVNLNLLGTKLTGFVVASGSPYLRTDTQIFGGKNNLSFVVERRDYKDHSIKDLLIDIFTDAGEKVGDFSLLSDIEVGHWMRLNEAASRAIKRLHKMFPANVVLRAGDDGSWSAVKLNWDNVIAELIERDIVNESPNDGTLTLIPTTGDIRPGNSVSVRGIVRKVDRVVYKIGTKLRVLLYLRDNIRDSAEDARLVRLDPNSADAQDILSRK